VSGDLWSVLVCALVTGGLSAAGPWLIARLPEPVPESEPEAEADVDVELDAAFGTSGDSPSHLPAGPTPQPMTKIPYVDLAARPRLALRLGLVGALVGAAIGWRLGFEPILATWVYLGAIGVVLGYVDSVTRLLPTWVIGPSYGVVVALILVAYAFDRDTDLLLRSGLGWLTIGGIYFVMWFIYPPGLGYGDVRLSGLLGLALGYIGWAPVVTGLYAGFLLGGVVGGLLALLKVFDRKRLPFGPFMLVGALVGLVWGQVFADWYTAF
jgi:leader peptidase (prepilin peptidase)/N-methyltransferase